MTERKGVWAGLATGVVWVPLSVLAFDCAVVEAISNGALVAAVSILVLGGAFRPLWRRREG